MVDRLLDADRVIHQQILGWEWHPPTQALTSARGESAGGAAARGGGGGSAAAAGGGGGGGSGGGGGGSAAGSRGASRGGGAGVPRDEGKDGAEAAGAEDAAVEMDNDARLARSIATENAKNHSERVRTMLGLLVLEAEFLLDSRTLEAASGLPDDEASVVKADAIVKALDISTEADVGVLLSYFFDAEDGDPASAAAAGTAMGVGRLKVSQDQVVAVCRQFVEAREVQRREVCVGVCVCRGGGGGGGMIR